MGVRTRRFRRGPAIGQVSYPRLSWCQHLAETQSSSVLYRPHHFEMLRTLHSHPYRNSRCVRKISKSIKAARNFASKERSDNANRTREKTTSESGKRIHWTHFNWMTNFCVSDMITTTSCVDIVSMASFSCWHFTWCAKVWKNKGREKESSRHRYWDLLHYSYANAAQHCRTDTKWILINWSDEFILTRCGQRCENQ